MSVERSHVRLSLGRMSVTNVKIPRSRSIVRQEEQILNSQIGENFWQFRMRCNTPIY